MAEEVKKDAAVENNEVKADAGKNFSGKFIGICIITFIIIALAMTVYYMIPEDLSTVDIKDNVTEIEENAYKNKDGIKTVLIGKNVKKIGNWAFFGCNSIEKDVVIPAGVKEIGWAAFAGVKSVSVDPKNTTFFSVPADAKVTIADGKLVAEGGNAKAGKVIIGKKALKNGSIEWTLYYCSPMVAGKYAVPAGVASIEHYAFYNCSKLTAVALPDSVKKLGSAAFMGCKNLENVVLADGITQLRPRTFSGCEKLSNIKLDKITKIEFAAFHGCNALTEVIFPDTIEKIATYAFFECANLKKAEVYRQKDKKGNKFKAEEGKKIADIGHNAFSDTHSEFKLVERSKAQN